MADLRLILVTPEKTLFDREVVSIRVPLFDGSIGIYPKRAPLVGRLGVGELRLETPDGKNESYFIENGFVQVKGQQVSVLTNAALPVSKISRAAAAKELEDARNQKASTDEQMSALAHKLDRARKMVSMATID
ncbi:MAG: ATP synthase F1 subunit epsilon [Planctomycetaceae bacterium]